MVIQQCTDRDRPENSFNMNFIRGEQTPINLDTWWV